MGRSDSELLHNAVRSPVAKLTAVETETSAHALDIIQSLQRELAGRPSAMLPLVASENGAVELLEKARTATRAWPEEEGVLFVTDETPVEATGALDFWRAINLQREAWAALGCHVIFFLFPGNYRLFLTAADHFADWVSLKLHLIEDHSLANQIAGAMTESSSYFPSTTPEAQPDSQRAFLCRMEVALADELAAGQSDPETLTRRFYLPMLEAAVTLYDLHRAKGLRAKIMEPHVRPADLPEWWRLSFYLDVAFNDLPAARATAQRLLEWARGQRNAQCEAMALHLLGREAQERRDLNAAEDFFTKSLEIEKRLGNERGAAFTYHQLGRIALERRDFNAAEEWYRKSLEIRERLGEKLDAARAYHQLGIIALERRDFGGADESYRKALETTERLGDEMGAAKTYHQLGVIAQQRRDFSAAEKWYRKSLDNKERLGDELGVARTFHQLGTLAQERREFNAAEEYYRKSLEIAERLSDEEAAAQTYHQLGIIAQERRDFNAAEEWYRRSLQIEERMGDELGAASTYHQLGMISQERRNFTAAEGWYRKSLEIKERLGDQHATASTYGQMGSLESSQGHWTEASRWLLRSIKVFTETNDPAEVARGIKHFQGIYEAASPEEKEKIKAMASEAGLSDSLHLEEAK